MEGNEDLSSNRDLSFADADMIPDDMGDDMDEDEFDDEDSYGSFDSGDEESSDLIEILPRVAVQNLKGNGGSVNDNISIGSLPNPPYEIDFDGGVAQDPNQPENANHGFVVEVENSHPHGAQNNEDESYYSVEEQESYEPPMSYDQENDSVLSIESNDNNYYASGADGEIHAAGGPNDMEDYDDFDNASGGSLSEDDSENQVYHQHQGRMIGVHQHSMNISHMPVHAQLWHQVNSLEADPLETKMITRMNDLHSILESVAVSHWPYKSFISGIQ